jgi:hypothetical protein
VTSPVQDFTSWTWEQMLQYVLNEGKDGSDGSSGTLADRKPIGGPDAIWVRFMERWTTTNDGAKPPNVKAGDRELLGYRPIGTGIRQAPITVPYSQYAPTTAVDTTTWEIVRAKIMFWDAPSEGATTPAAAFETFHKAGAGSLERMTSDSITYFRRKNFTDAAIVLQDIETWLKNSDPTLKGLYDSINRDSSGFQGSAAAVFTAALHNLREGVHRLSLDMSATSDELAWSDRVRGKSYDMNNYRDALQTAWNAYESTTYQYDKTYNPGHLIDGIKQILTGMDQGNLHAITVDFSREGSPLSGTFDLSTENGWNQLNSHLKAAWMREMTTLDTAMHTALTTLTTLLRDTESALSHFGNPRYQDPDGKPNNDGNGGGGDGGGGKDNSNIDLSKLGGGGGGGGGGSNLDLSKLGGGGGGGSGGGGNLDLSGLNKALGGGGSGGGGGGLDLSGLGLGGSGSGGGSGLGGLGSGGGGSGLGNFDSSGLSRGIANGLASGLRGGLGSVIGGSSNNQGKGGSAGGSGPDYDDLAGKSVANQFPTAVDGVDIGNLAGSSGSRPAGGSAVGSDLAALLDGTGSPGATAGGLARAGALGSDSGGAMGGTAATAGSSGYPFMPPMGGMGGMGGMGNQQGERERERKTWLEEEEEVWGTEPDCGPAVIGRGNVPETQPTRPSQPAGPRRPAQPMGPARGTGRGRS